MMVNLAWLLTMIDFYKQSVSCAMRRSAASVDSHDAIVSTTSATLMHALAVRKTTLPSPPSHPHQG